MRYQVGMYGGSFNPLHMGHVHCILQGANLCKEFFIVLSVGKNRDEIDYRIRYRWLYELTLHIGNVKILVIEDTSQTKMEYTSDLWQKDADFIKEQIDKRIDAVFCGSDYDKNSFWHICYPKSEIVIFPRNEISSTVLRNNPYTYWHWLPQIVRPYYVKKVLLMGSESTGKSTLTINLAHHFNTNYIGEAGREISARSGTDLLMLSTDFTEILLLHKLNEINAVKESNGLLFVDTDALVTQFYMEFLEDSEKAKNKKLSDAIDAINEYSLILFLEPDVTFVQDGDRSEVIHSDRAKYSEQLKAILQAHGKNFISISGDYQTRYELAVAQVEKLLGNRIL